MGFLRGSRNGKTVEQGGGVTLRPVAPLVLTALCLSQASAHLHAQATNGEGPLEPTVTFKAGVEVVTVTAAVRDGRGRVVRNLQRDDFEVIDSGEARELRDFYAGEAPISLALLLDISGSMAVGGNIHRARHAIAEATGALGGRDEAALFTFDSKLEEVVAFTHDLARIRRVGLEGRPWGLTSLYDAVAAAARAVAERNNRNHRALLVITDGVDTGSKMTGPEVSRIASAIDVPVYLLAVVTPVDHPGGEFGVALSERVVAGNATLADLSAWTGGDMRVASEPRHIVEAIRDLFTELRYQYLMTFEPDARPGWHPLTVRTRNKDLVVHARGGYVSEPAPAED
jgi:VWFA-related protein